MSKIKSAILITLFTLVIAALCFACTVSFSYGTNGMYTFNSIIRMTAKDADLGGFYGAQGYNGGGYSVVYYPEGVISAKEYQDNLGGYDEGSDEQTSYAEKYVAYANGALYLEKDEVCDGGETPSAEFKAAFDSTLSLLQERFALLRKDGAELTVTNDYTVRAFLPKNIMDSSLFAFLANSYVGALTVRYGSDDSTAETILPARANKTIADYFKGASSRVGADGTAYVVLDFTEEGQKAIADATADSNTMYFMVGENTIIPLTVSESIDQATLYISGSYTSETAAVCANVLNTAFHAENPDLLLELTIGDSYQYEALYGGNALLSLYIAFGAIFLAMMIFFFVKYHRLGFTQLYTYLIFTIAMLLCVWSISFIYLSVETLIAFLLASLLLTGSNVAVFENTKKEFALGKTIVSSVKTAYKRCLFPLLDLHLVVAALGFLFFGIGLTNLSVFGFVLGLGAVFSAICSLAVNRLMWACMMSFASNKGKFCNFKREEVEEDD